MLSHPASTRRRRIAVLVTFLLVTVGLLVGPFADRAHAEGTATTFVVDATVRADGRLEVEQTMTFAAPVPAQVSQRFETRAIWSVIDGRSSR